MENTPNQQNGQNASDRPAQEPAGEQAEQKQQQTGKGFWDSLGCAMHKGAEEARNAAEIGIPKMLSAVADAAYWAAYGVSFASVFQWTVARRFTPECLKAGCRDGVKAGKEAADTWLDALIRRQEKATAPSADHTGSTPEAVQHVGA